MSQGDLRPERVDHIRFRGPDGRYAPSPHEEHQGKVTKENRRRHTHVRTLAKAYTTEALGTLLEILRKGRENNKLKAAELILAYAWGRPAQVAVTEDSEGNPLQGLSTKELQIILVRALQEPESPEPQDSEDKDDNDGTIDAEFTVHDKEREHDGTNNENEDTEESGGVRGTGD